jgi:chaperone modulatory protein CbpM
MRLANTDDIEVIETLSLIELSTFCHVQTDWVIALVDYGVLEPLGNDASDWHFAAPYVLRARKARRLTHDLGLNLAGVALVLELIEERDALARRLAQLEHHFE